ncbi:hypothetical protein [Clostridium perfringens]|uniref:hypothetical protein n=1 Tax=Clostridium perfringens TaxID=1502 RepID=UPI001B83B386|nr:hypothetical protein [Clostridium perfringens]HBC2033297.1 hypothetical protein [Clostridium perfringens]HBC2056704.1 hypothetical protein [Clostridium perfringens]HBC2070824.1 hypothetical protein [Clostridium perfringens]
MNKNHKKIIEYVVSNIDLSNKEIVKLGEKSIAIVDGDIALYFTIRKNEVLFLTPLNKVSLD